MTVSSDPWMRVLNGNAVEVYDIALWRRLRRAVASLLRGLFAEPA